ncbi:serine hydrolase domain-containing protein [Bacteroidota bacterium]
MTFINFRIFLIPVIVSLILSGSIACDQGTENQLDSIINGEAGTSIDNKLTPYCENIIAAYDLPGLAVGIVKNNEIVYARSFGYKNIETKEPVSITSLFHMASISKPFVATAIMQLVEQGKIDLDATVITYLPYFKLEGEHYDEITIKQMLNHISGMPDVQDYEWYDPVYDAGALEKYVRSISAEKMRSVPGEEFAYSNMAFECLGDVIAKVSGLSFADYVKQNILSPTGMKESTFLKPDHLPENWAAPHLRFMTMEPWDGYPYNRMHGPSSTLHSNVVEMCNWAMINMNRGSLNGNTILDQASYDLLWKPWFKTGENSDVGLSWFLGKYREETTISHGGGDTGFNTFFVMLPEKSIAVVVLCNFSPAPVYRIKDAALDIIFGYEPESYLSPAIIPVTKELKLNGLEAAIAMWDSLTTNHPEKYDFNSQLFTGLYTAVDLDREKEAVLFTQLYVNILNEEVIDALKSEAEFYSQQNPKNRAVPAALKTIQEFTDSEGSE